MQRYFLHFAFEGDKRTHDAFLRKLQVARALLHVKICSSKKNERKNEKKNAQGINEIERSQIMKQLHVRRQRTLEREIAGAIGEYETNNDANNNRGRNHAGTENATETKRRNKGARQRVCA